MAFQIPQLTKTKSKITGQDSKLSVQDILKKILLSEYFVLYLSIIYFLVLTPFVSNLASFENMGNIVSNMWPLFAVAVGQTVVLIIAGIDLSQTSIMGMTSVVGAMIMTSKLDPVLFSKSPLWGWFVNENGGPLANSLAALPVAIIVMLITGVLIGILNGLAITKLRMTPFMVTLVSQIFFGAFAIFLTKSQNVISLPQAYKEIGNGGISFIPYAMLIAIALAAIAHILLGKTMLGRWLYSTGTNMKASKTSGVPTDKVIIFAYAFSGFCAAIASILYSARLGMGRPTLGANILMDIIGATVIGGTSMFGGKGKVLWTLFGVLFFVLLSNTLNLLNLSYFTINIVKGAVILLAALIDVTRTRIMAREYRVEKAGN